MAKTSLERSHSKSSNFKLTLICALLSIMFVLLFIGLILIKSHQTLGIILTAVGAVGFIFSFMLVSKFTR